MKKHGTAFYVETLLLMAAFAVMIPVLTGIFGGARAQSAKAAQLNRSVILAENAAEAVAASDSPEGVQQLLEENGNTALAGNVLTVYNEEGYTTRIEFQAESSLLSAQIRVLYNEEEIYTLHTAVYTGEVGR